MHPISCWLLLLPRCLLMAALEGRKGDQTWPWSDSIRPFLCVKCRLSVCRVFCSTIFLQLVLVDFLDLQTAFRGAPRTSENTFKMFLTSGQSSGTWIRCGSAGADVVCEVLVRLSCADNRVGGDWAGGEICGEEPAGRCWCCQTSKCFLLGVLTEMSGEMHEVSLLCVLISLQHLASVLFWERNRLWAKGSHQGSGTCALRGRWKHLGWFLLQEIKGRFLLMTSSKYVR